MSLAAAQNAMMAQILDEDRPLPLGWGEREAAGMDIYRNAYRARLIDTLAENFERTQQWVGEDAFRRAAAHHLITHAPNGWTIDDAAIGFDATLAELFADDPDVAELGWLEWAMHRAFIAADCEPLGAAGFGEATAELAESEWEKLGFTFVTGLVHRSIRHDTPALWRSLVDGADAPDPLELADKRGLVVWRENLTPAFRMIDTVERECIELAESGGAYGPICGLLVERLGEEAAIPFAGEMLGRWLGDGWIAELNIAGSQAL